MLVVIALGGSALLRRGEDVIADNLRAGIRQAARALAPVAAHHQLVIGLGHGPQTGLLTLQGAAHARVETFPLDVFSCQAEGMISYMLEQELGNLLPAERSIATILTMTEVDPDDRAFGRPTTFIGPVYLREEAEQLVARKGWVFRPDGDKWRRVVAAPEPKRIIELRPITWLLERNAVVIAEGGGGIPAMRENGRRFTGVECAIDTDLVSALLARELEADLLVMVTDTDAAYVDWGRPDQRPIRCASPSSLATLPFPSCSMGSKVNAACRFVQATGRNAAIGALPDLSRVLVGEAGTTVSARAAGITFGADVLVNGHR